MLKNLLLLLIILTSLTSCYTGTYALGLKEVERPATFGDRFGRTVVIPVNEDGQFERYYEDEFITVFWYPNRSSFDCTIVNNTDNSIKIIWDEAVYINEADASIKVAHGDVYYPDIYKSSPPTIIPKNTRKDEVIYPIYNIKKGYGSKPHFPYQDDNRKMLEIIGSSYIGKLVHIILPIEVKEEINDYTFTFRVNDFKIDK